MKTATLPKPLQAGLDAAAKGYAGAPGMPSVDFTVPKGEPALVAPDSVSWRVFKNPIALYIGGITAVLLELAEPRVRSGVWDHTSFKTDPLPRMKRTGLAAMMTVYGPKSAAEKMIAGVGRMHGRVTGQTPAGVAYRADDPELLNWVQATASYGFMNAYHRFVAPLSDADRNRFYAEAAPAAALYGATGAPGSETALEAQFEAMAPKLERSQIVFDFLDIMKRTAALPGPLRLLQPILMRAAIDLLPGWTRDILGLGGEYALKPWQASLVRWAGRSSDRLVIKAAPPAQACIRLGLSADCLYKA